MNPDLYELLGVERTATDDELKRAFRQQARRYHPDLNPDDPEAERRFKEVTWAYEVLSDRVRRTQYDRFGRVFTDGRSQGPFGVGDDFDLSDVLGSVFRDLFGGRKRRGGPSKRDLRYTITITLEEAARGVDKEVSFTRKQHDGSTTSEKLRVKVPAGVDTGQRLKVRGKGQGAGGDLYVVVNVVDHAFFRRRGVDVFCDVPVTYAQALLGAELEVPTPTGTTVIRLPPSTQPGTVLTVRGQGLPRVGKGSSSSKRVGDLFCKVVLDMPTDLPDGAAEQLLALDRLLAAAPSPIREIYERVVAEARSDKKSKAG